MDFTMGKIEKATEKAVNLVKSFGYGFIHPIRAAEYDFDDDEYNESAVLAGSALTGGLAAAAVGIVGAYAIVGAAYTKAYNKGDIAVRDAQYQSIWRAKDGYYIENSKTKTNSEGES